MRCHLPALDGEASTCSTHPTGSVGQSSEILCRKCLTSMAHTGVGISCPHGLEKSSDRGPTLGPRAEVAFISFLGKGGGGELSHAPT